MGWGLVFFFLKLEITLFFNCNDFFYYFIFEIAFFSIVLICLFVCGLASYLFVCFFIYLFLKLFILFNIYVLIHFM